MVALALPDLAPDGVQLDGRHPERRMQDPSPAEPQNDPVGPAHDLEADVG